MDAYNTGGFKGEGFSMATLTLYNREKTVQREGGESKKLENTRVRSRLFVNTYIINTCSIVTNVYL